MQITVDCYVYQVVGRSYEKKIDKILDESKQLEFKENQHF